MKKRRGMMTMMVQSKHRMMPTPIFPLENMTIYKLKFSSKKMPTSLEMEPKKPWKILLFLLKNLKAQMKDIFMSGCQTNASLFVANS